MINKIKRTWLLIYYITFFFSLITIALSILLYYNLIKIDRAYKYIIYALTLFLLLFSLYSLITKFKFIKDETKNILKENKFTRKIIKEYDFRTAIFALGSLLINLGMLAYYLGFTVFRFNYWFLSLTIYYTLLFLAREITLYIYYKYGYNEEKIINVHKICGILLCFLPLYLYVAVREMVGSNFNYRYAKIHVIVIAAITFYKLILGIVNASKAHKTKSLLTIALRNINLAEVSVSMVALASMMVDNFGDEILKQKNEQLVFLTGVIVTILTLIIGISMIRRAIKDKTILTMEVGINGLENVYRRRK